jgi:hypothetical protein
MTFIIVECIKASLQYGEKEKEKASFLLVEIHR